MDRHQSHQKRVPQEIYFSFFMFTTDLRLSDVEYTKVIIKHMQELKKLGYTGFELPIGQGGTKEYPQELEEYTKLRQTMDEQGLADLHVATNVGATQLYDPSSPFPEIQQRALEYLKSRIDITVALRGDIMMGPLVIPYSFSQLTAFPTFDTNTHIWSDQLQDYLDVRYTNAQPILEKLGHYAERMHVKVAIEPITHWETSGPNTLAQLIEFLEGVSNKHVGVVIDSSHEILDGDGPAIFATQVNRLAAAGRLHYVQISPPDRGAVHTSWIPWQSLFGPILRVYNGPIAIEIFNAIPVFLSPLHMTRRKFWIPGEDRPHAKYPDAYTIAGEAITAARTELQNLVGTPTER
jgi:D-psicose/D-tagatose/L-ribulose 3-epimerase